MLSRFYVLLKDFILFLFDLQKFSSLRSSYCFACFAFWYLSKGYAELIVDPAL